MEKSTVSQEFFSQRSVRRKLILEPDLALSSHGCHAFLLSLLRPPPPPPPPPPQSSPLSPFPVLRALRSPTPTSRFPKIRPLRLRGLVLVPSALPSGHRLDRDDPLRSVARRPVPDREVLDRRGVRQAPVPRGLRVRPGAAIRVAAGPGHEGRGDGRDCGAARRVVRGVDAAARRVRVAAAVPGEAVLDRAAGRDAARRDARWVL